MGSFPEKLILFLPFIKWSGDTGNRFGSTVGRRPISRKTVVNFDLGLFFFRSKAFSRIIFLILFGDCR